MHLDEIFEYKDYSRLKAYWFWAPIHGDRLTGGAERPNMSPLIY